MFDNAGDGISIDHPVGWDIFAGGGAVYSPYVEKNMQKDPDLRELEVFGTNYTKIATTMGIDAGGSVGVTYTFPLFLIKTR